MTAYYVKSGTEGDDSGSSWANAAESIAGLMAAQALTGGDIIYVHNTHNYNAGAAITWTLPEGGTAGLILVLCVDGGDPTGASLSGAGSLTTGARETTGGNYQIIIQTVNDATASLYVHGITIEAGAGASSSSADISIAASTSGTCYFSACTIFINSTNVGAQLFIGNASSAPASSGIFENCTFKFGTTSAGQGIFCYGGHWEFRNCTATGGSAPNALFNGIANARASISCHGCDFTNCTYVVNQATACGQKYQFFNCSIATPVGGTRAAGRYPIAEFQACAAADGTNGADVLSYYYESASGIVEDDQSVVLTTGPAQGTQDDGTATSYSLKMTPSANASQFFPLYTPWLWKKVTSTGDKTITIKVADSETDADELHTSQVFLEIEYMGEPGATGTQRLANSPMAIFEVDDDCPVISGTIYRDVIAAGADRTDTDEAWSNLSETNTYTLTGSVNIAEQGYIRCRVGLAIDTTNPVYVDPKIGVA